MSQTPEPIGRIGIIGGSGMEQALGIAPPPGDAVAWPHPDATVYRNDTPFGPTSAPISLTQWEGVDVAILKRHGIGHIHNPSAVPYRANIYAMKELGVTHLIASGATGSLREHIKPGDVALVDQVIDKTTKRPHTFYEHTAAHVEFAEPFCPIMRDWLLNAAKLEGVLHDDQNLHTQATYVCMEGPAFSTRAESEMHRQWGGDLIGMTAMPEAKLAREAEIAYALIGLPTDYDCWKTEDTYDTHSDLLSQIIANLNKASNAGVRLIKAALRDTTLLRTHASPAHTALDLGLWSDKSRLDPAEVQRLAVLWGRHFE